MIVPQFWAEARVDLSAPKGLISVRRFGWSDVSEAEARAHAEQRAREACARSAAEANSFVRWEPRVGYNGAEGVPIREEIVSRHGETVITRNSYGALCLNTPDVMFMDVDEGQDSTGCLRGCLIFLPLAAGGFWLGSVLLNWKLGFPFLIAAAWLGIWINGLVDGAILRRKGGWTAIARKKVDQFIQDHPDWNLRLYRTPAGFRLLVMHRTFDPGSEEVAEIFNAAGTDEIYGTMCRVQRCFRARLTPKPWRIGMSGKGRPHRRVWPVPPESLAARRAWEEQYQRMADGFAACRFLGDFGNGPVHSSARAVQELHDRLSKAESGLPEA